MKQKQTYSKRLSTRQLLECLREERRREGLRRLLGSTRIISPGKGKRYIGSFSEIFSSIPPESELQSIKDLLYSIDDYVRYPHIHNLPYTPNYVTVTGRLTFFPCSDRVDRLSVRISFYDENKN